MRKIILLEFMTMDGVIQAPDGPDREDPVTFKYGGWTAPYFAEADAAAGDFVAKQTASKADLLLGKKTYDIFAAFWPAHGDLWPGVNDATKYVVSDSKAELSWENSELITGDDIVEQIKKLKASDGPDLQVHGSSVLAQTLLKNDLVDELWLKIFPITLGQGKKLFGEGTIPAAFTVTDSLVTSNGVIFVNYKRAGEVKTAVHAVS